MSSPSTRSCAVDDETRHGPGTTLTAAVVGTAAPRSDTFTTCVPARAIRSAITTTPRMRVAGPSEALPLAGGPWPSPGCGSRPLHVTRPAAASDPIAGLIALGSSRPLASDSLVTLTCDEGAHERERGREDERHVTDEGKVLVLVWVWVWV